MAGDTICGQMLTGQRKRGCRMIEGRGYPGCGVVAGCAILAETLLSMVRAGSSTKGGLVTGETGIGSAGITGRMAGVAPRDDMRAGQGKAGCGVIIVCRLPGSRGMTGCADLREAARFVVGFDCRGKFRAVAGVAIIRGADITCLMTGLAGDPLMSSGQRERCRVI